MAGDACSMGRRFINKRARVALFSPLSIYRARDRMNSQMERGG